MTGWIYLLALVLAGTAVWVATRCYFAQQPGMRAHGAAVGLVIAGLALVVSNHFAIGIALFCIGYAMYRRHFAANLRG